MVNQLVSPQLFTACEEGRVEDVVQLLSSGVGANVTDEVSKVCTSVGTDVHAWIQVIHLHVLFLAVGRHSTSHCMPTWPLSSSADSVRVRSRSQHTE